MHEPISQRTRTHTHAQSQNCAQPQSYSHTPTTRQLSNSTVDPTVSLATTRGWGLDQVLLGPFNRGLSHVLLNTCMELEKDSTHSTKGSHGGARPGAGRPKGSTDKLTARLLLETCEQVIGKPFEVSLLEGYRDAILADDRRNRAVYEKMLLDKVSSTLIEADVTDTTDTAAAKALVFQEAPAKLQLLGDKAK